MVNECSSAQNFKRCGFMLVQGGDDEKLFKLRVYTIRGAKVMLNADLTEICVNETIFLTIK